MVICVPTPVDEHRGAGPARAARRRARPSSRGARPGQMLILTSTTYVGCTRDLLVEPLRRRGLEAGRDVSVAFSPERIDPANDALPARAGCRGSSAACTTDVRRARAAAVRRPGGADGPRRQLAPRRPR